MPQHAPMYYGQVGGASKVTKSRNYQELYLLKLLHYHSFTSKTENPSKDVLMEGDRKKRYFLGLCPKLWVDGGPKS